MFRNLNKLYKSIRLVFVLECGVILGYLINYRGAFAYFSWVLNFIGFLLLNFAAFSDGDVFCS